MHSDLVINRGNQKVTANGKVELDDEHPIIEVNIDHPDGKSRLLYRYDKKVLLHFLIIK